MIQAAAFHASRQLNSADVYCATEHCPVCLNNGERKPVMRLQSSPVVELLECARCRACSASYMPKPDVLNQYYSDYYAAGEEKITCPNSARFASTIAAYSGLSDKSGTIRILDYGGGDGTLARKIADKLAATSRADFEINVIDYQEPGDYGTERIQVQGYRTLEQAAGQYDLVIASAVLEHIPEVSPIMRRLFELVRPGGCLYARTPWVLPMARLVRRLDFTYPGHVHDMGSSFWNRVTETFNLNARCIISRPSMLETTLRSHPARTLVAALLKAPARFEGLLSPGTRKDRWWGWVGGWEIMLRFGGRQ